MDDMGLFRTTIEVQDLERRGSRRALPDTLVDTGSEYTWIPRAVLEELGVVAQRQFSLEALNVKIDPVKMELVPAGPVIAAAAA